METSQRCMKWFIYLFAMQAVWQPVFSTLWPRLKYINNHWMDCCDILYGHSSLVQYTKHASPWSVYPCCSKILFPHVCHFCMWHMEVTCIIIHSCDLWATATVCSLRAVALCDIKPYMLYVPPLPVPLALWLLSWQRLIPVPLTGW